MTPFGDLVLGHHWFRYGLVPSGTNDDLSPKLSVAFIHTRAILQDMLMHLIRNNCSEIIL